MQGKKRSLFFIIPFLLLLIGHREVYAQKSLLDKRLSFSVSNMPVVNVLNKIAVTAGVKFSYNPDLIPVSHRITQRFTNLPVREILQKVLDDPSISIKEIGNQIVLYRGTPPSMITNHSQQLAIGKPVASLQQKNGSDTVFMVRTDTLYVKKPDTIFRTVSIMRFDTVYFHDTVFIGDGGVLAKEGLRNRQAETDSISLPEFARGWYVGFGLAWMPSMLNWGASGNMTTYQIQMEKANISWNGSHFFELLAGYNFRHFGIRSGFAMTWLGEKFAWSYAVETGGFYKTDTVETYYSVAGADTNWFYITDSTWIPKNSKEFTYKNPNRYRYLEVPFSVKINILRFDNCDMYAMGGGSAGFLANANALQLIKTGEQGVQEVEKEMLSPIVFSANAGLGLNLKISEKTVFMTEVFYRKQLTNQYKGSEFEKKCTCWGLKAGIWFKL